MADFRYSVPAWEPFDYFSTRMQEPARDGVSMPETYHLVATDTGTALRYTMGQAQDADGNRSEDSEKDTAGFLAEFWPACFDEMEVLYKAAD